MSMQAFQNFVGRRCSKRLARWIFRTRIRLAVRRGEILSARVVEGEEPA